ncbi:MAG: hypothetical protein AB198_00615 [Parcubacteria bacterium C7867-003]|nr:MAG: hypothetical protein AB198_00615 [Parcubacteria bacterium C7867-003]
MLIQDKKYLVILLAVNILTIILAFFWVGPYSVRTDTDHYVNQINVMRGDVEVDDLEGPFKEMYYYKIYKPIYGLLSVWPLGSLEPLNVILFLNIIFLVGLTISSYYLFKHLGFEEKFSFYGAVWVATGYPVFKYGLALVTDISGWFFAVLSILVFLYGVKSNRLNLVILASLVGFVGSISKETGVLGLLFCGLYLLFHYRDYTFSKFLKVLASLCAPFLILQITLMLIMSKLNASSLFEWVKFNYRIFFEDFYKLKYFLTNEFLAFGLVWVFACLGFYFLLREKFWQDREKFILLLSAILATSAVLLWPVFYYRILFIQLIFVMPLGLYGARKILNKYEQSLGKVFSESILLFPVLLNIVLFLLIKKY